ncbi:MAG: YmaF family protein [Desulfitobacterium sp.]
MYSHVHCLQGCTTCDCGHSHSYRGLY